MSNVFFYGLFMDVDLLRDKGIASDDPRVAKLDGHALEIGERATLVRARDSQVYGVVMSVTREDLQSLYAEPSVADYRPTKVSVTIASGPAIAAHCYVLPEVGHSQVVNRDYAIKLLDLAKRLGLPSAYLAQIEGFARA